MQQVFAALQLRVLGGGELGEEGVAGLVVVVVTGDSGER